MPIRFIFSTYDLRVCYYRLSYLSQISVSGRSLVYVTADIGSSNIRTSIALRMTMHAVLLKITFFRTDYFSFQRTVDAVHGGS